MKKFIKYICVTIIAMFALLYLLDVCYTNVYCSHYKRTKFQYLRSFQNKKIDYVFLGSSRVENNINPIIIDSLTGKTSVNFGFQAVKLQDILLLVKLMNDYNITYERLFIQVDYIYNLEKDFSNILEYQLVPFYSENKNIQEHFLNIHDKRYVNTLNVPFLRYAYYDQKNGIREVISNLRDTDSKYESTKGFSHLNGYNLSSGFELPGNIIKSNTYFEQINRYILNNNINVTYFCGAVRNDTKNADYLVKLKQQIPELIDLSKTIDDTYLFKDNLHLNKKGADLFSVKIVGELNL